MRPELQEELEAHFKKVTIGVALAKANLDHLTSIRECEAFLLGAFVGHCFEDLEEEALCAVLDVAVHEWREKNNVAAEIDPTAKMLLVMAKAEEYLGNKEEAS